MTSSSSSSSSKRQFDVFVSFRGRDTRNTFTSYLLESLRRKGIDAFFDGKLLRGKNISVLFDRIEQSKMSIVVFSKNYANSTWCLDELWKIIQCREEFGHEVLPIFYKVSKSDVQNQKGRFGAPFLTPEESFKEDCHRVEAWKEALKTASNILGHVLPEDRPEIEFVETIAKETFRMLNDSSPCTIRGFPGIESRSKELEELLMFDNANCTRTVGVLGVAGIGKTTVVDSVYKRNHRQFDGYCFLEDIENESKRHGLHRLHQKLVCKLLDEQIVDVRAHGRLEDFLRNKKLFIVLDNVTEENQINVLVGEQELYRKGSRIVITTRDEKLLSRNFDATYVVPRLNDSEAMELFCLKAFSDEQLYPPEEFVHLSNNFVYYAKGDPLALKLLGSDLRQMKKTYWMEKWKSLRVTPDKEIQQVLKTAPDKRIYLDITSVLRSVEADCILKSDGVNAAAVMRDLQDKCLVTISYNHFEMHDQDIQKRTSTMSFQLQPILQNSNHIILQGKYPMATSSVVSSVPRHQVFLSYRGEIRLKFITHLTKALKDKHINVYIDDPSGKGQNLDIPSKQIEKSRIALAIFSKGYTESACCLKELVKIKERMDEGKLVAIPIFYDMEPKTVIHFRGAFGDALRVQRQSFGDDQANKWEEAFKSVCERVGFIYDITRPESEFVETIAKETFRMLNNLSPCEIRGSATGPPPVFSDRPKSSVDKEGQKVVHLKLQLRDDEKKTKALSTIAKISGVSSVAVDGYERISVTGDGTMDPAVLVEKLSKYWPAEIISVGPSKKIEGKEETSEEQLEKQVEKSVKSQKFKDEESVLSVDLSAGAIITTNTSIVVFSWNNDLDVEETSFIKSILKELHEREVTHVKYNLSGSDSLDTEMLYRSSVGIMLISNSFAPSSQSLDHLVVIMEHWKEKSFVIIPVYIKVTPSDICQLADRVDASLKQQLLKAARIVLASIDGTQFTLAEEVGRDAWLYWNSLPKWDAAMNELASIDGHQWTEGTQFTLAEEVVRDAWLYLRNCKNVVRILALLKHGQSSDAEVVGLWGMAGIGKTFAAREIFGILAPQYDSCCILEDFYRLRKKEGLRQMRDDFFTKIFGEEKLNACDIKPRSMKNWFLNKKILVVLDGVGSARDAEYVVGGFDWFSRGHRIILTSRRKQVLVQCKVKEPYEINKLCEFESLRLCKQFLNGEKSGMISEVMSCSSGIPLALEVLGSSVSKQQIENMKEHLESLRKDPPSQIREAFQRSFDGLDENDKNLFLDLACFFGGENKDHVVQLLDACGFFTSLGICNLIDESLISLMDNKIEIPTPFQDMGRFIVREEDVDPWERSRLWYSKDIIGVLEKNSGTEAIEGIFLDMSDVTCELSPTVFCEMDRLRLLKFYCSTSGKECKLNLPPQGLDTLPDELRLLHWEHYPLKYLPQKFDPENLVEINMPYSNMEKLWEGKKNLEKLKIIKLSHSSKLTDIRMLSEALNLEHIDLEGCTSLVDISTSIPRCGKLVSLNMKDCSCLRILPPMVDLTYLKLLNLSGCSDLKKIQDCAPNLKELFLAGTAITKLSLSIANLNELVTLDLENCTRLRRLPIGIRKWRSIIDLNLSGCTSLN